MPKLDKKPGSVERRIFSTNFRAARQYTGFTIQQVSEITKISAPFVSMVESGNQNVTVLYMAELSYAVQVPLYVLLTPGFKPETFDNSTWDAYYELVRLAKPAVLEQKMLAEKARYYRKQAGLRQAQVDQLADFRVGTTTDLERMTGNMSIDVIAPIAPVLGIPFFQLFKPN